MQIDYDYYDGRSVKYPAHINKPVWPAKPDAVAARQYADDMDVYDEKKAAYDIECQKWRDVMARRLSELKDLIRADVGMTPEVFDYVWAEAYSKGHSYGLSEVVSAFYSLEEFIDKLPSSYTPQGAK